MGTISECEDETLWIDSNDGCTAMLTVHLEVSQVSHNKGKKTGEKVKGYRKERRQNQMGSPGSKIEVPGSKDPLTVNHRPTEKDGCRVRLDQSTENCFSLPQLKSAASEGSSRAHSPRLAYSSYPGKESSTEKGSLRAPSTSTTTAMAWIPENSTYPSALCHGSKMPDTYWFI